MNLSDISSVPITPHMISEAEAEMERRKSKWGATTRAAYELRDLVGSLAHQAVENKFDEFGFPYTSTRLEEYEKGDVLDIIYEDDTIDVKGTHGELNKQYFYNQEFLVFQQQLDSEKMLLISHLVFVQVGKNDAYIFGAITVPEFREKCRPVKLKYENQGIRAYQLTPFSDYVLRLRRSGLNHGY